MEKQSIFFPKVLIIFSILPIESGYAMVYFCCKIIFAMVEQKRQGENRQ